MISKIFAIFIKSWKINIVLCLIICVILTLVITTMGIKIKVVIESTIEGAKKFVILQEEIEAKKSSIEDSILTGDFLKESETKAKEIVEYIVKNITNNEYKVNVL